MKPVTDSGWTAAFRKFVEDGNCEVTVGIHEEDTDRETPTATNAEIGFFHEYGRGVPQHSFMRAPFDENQTKFVEWFKQLFSASAVGKISIHQVPDLMGMRVVSLLKQNIRAGISPPLSQKTIDMKGSSTPLIDTGQLINAIDYEVRQ